MYGNVSYECILDCPLSGWSVCCITKFTVLSSLMMLKGRSEKSFLLGSPATRTTSSHCWRRMPISSPSAPCFTHTQSTTRRQENSRTRFTRYKHDLPPHLHNPGSLLDFDFQFFTFLLVVVNQTTVVRFKSKPSQRCLFGLFATGWYYLPGIPRVSWAPADLPHVVHRDRQFHRCRRWSLGLLSCVSALLNWHQTPPHHHPSCTQPNAKAFIVSLKNKAPLWAACDQLPGQFDYISPVGELLIGQELPLCQKSFSDFSGARAELNTVVFWNIEQCLNSKKSLCRCFLYPGTY